MTQTYYFKVFILCMGLIYLQGCTSLTKSPRLAKESRVFLGGSLGSMPKMGPKDLSVSSQQEDQFALNGFVGLSLKKKVAFVGNMFYILGNLNVPAMGISAETHYLWYDKKPFLSSIIMGAFNFQTNEKILSPTESFSSYQRIHSQTTGLHFSASFGYELKEHLVFLGPEFQYLALNGTYAQSLNDTQKLNTNGSGVGFFVGYESPPLEMEESYWRLEFIGKVLPYPESLNGSKSELRHIITLNFKYFPNVPGDRAIKKVLNFK